MASPIYTRATDNILAGAVITATVAPLSTYALTTLAALDPAQRVRWGVTTVTITFTLAGPKLGVLLVIPMHNLTPGSSSVLTLTNGAGFSHVIARPALRADGWPPTLVVDLTGFDTPTNRTATVWNLVIVGNASDVQLGGAIAIYSPLRSFLDLTVTDGFVTKFLERKKRNRLAVTNDHGSRYVQDYRTVSRQIDTLLVVPAALESTIDDWYDANHGSVEPSLVWPDPAIVDGYFGTWQETREKETLRGGLRSFAFVFDELSKGLVIA